MVEKSIKEIFNDRKWSKATERDFFAEVYKHLDKGVEKGFERTFVDLAYNSPDFELLSNLKYNAGVLAAFKNHHNANDMLQALFDDDGNMRNWKNFKAAAEAINSRYNKTWLKTEYDTAVAQANAASQWLEYEKDKALYPNLKYIQIDRDTKNKAHVKWHGLILPIEHPFWDKHYPPNDWGCGCTVEQSDERVKTKGLDVNNIPDNKPGFNINAGKHGKVVSGDHPYFKVNDYNEVAKNAMSLYQQFKMDEYLPILKKQWQGKAFTVGDIDIHITELGLTNSLKAEHKRAALKDDLLLKLDEVMDNLMLVTKSKVDRLYKLESFEDMFVNVRLNKDTKLYELSGFSDALD